VQNNKQAARKLKTQNPDQTHTGARSSNGQESPQSWYEEDSRVMVHWYSPFWGPGTTRGRGFKLNPVRGVVCPLMKLLLIPLPMILTWGCQRLVRSDLLLCFQKIQKKQKQNKTQEADPREADHYKRVDEASHNSLTDFLYTKSLMASKWKSAVYIRGKQMSMKEQREQNRRRNSVGSGRGMRVKTRARKEGRKKQIMRRRTEEDGRESSLETQKQNRG
jgi:hypothetical protein